MTPIQRLLIVQAGALVWLAVLGTTLVAREPARATLRGTVVAKETGQPIPGATVEVRGADYQSWRNVKTNAQGAFVARGLPPGRVMLQASSTVHRMPKEVEVTLREGDVNCIRLLAPPVDPFLELAMPQRVYLPREAPQATLSGYTKGDTLQLAVRRITWSDLRSAHDSPATPQDEGLRVPPGVGESVYSEEIGAAPRDPEGALRRKIELQPLSEGIYSLWLTGRDAKVATVFSVSRIGLVTKVTKRTLLAYVVDLDSGRPVPGAAITLFRGPSEVGSGSTNDDGLFRTDRPEAGDGNAERVIAQAGESVAFTRAESYSYDPDRPVRTYLYTDRPIYRTGQTVYYKAIARERDGSLYRVPSGLPVRLQIYAPSGALLAETTARANDYGSFHGEFRLAPDAAIGQYRVETAAGGGVVAGSGSDKGVSEQTHYFNVAEYRKPEYQVEVTTEPGPDGRRNYVRGDPVRVTVTARYFWGAPVKDATVEYSVTRRSYWSGGGEEEEAWADFYSRSEEERSGEPVMSGKARTDANGRFTFTFETTLKEPENQDHLYLIDAEVTDPSRLSVTGAARAVVSRGTFRLQLDPERWVVAPGDPFPIRIRTVNFDGTPRPNVAVSVAIGADHSNPQSGTAEPREVVIRNPQSINTGLDGTARLTLPTTRPGSLHVVASVVDERGNHFEESTWLWVASGEEGFSDPHFDYAELELVADKKIYQPGETARVMILTSRPGDSALVTIEGRDLYSARVVRLAANSTPIEVPIEQAYQPNVYLSVTLVRGKTYRSRDLRLKVSPQEHALQVRVTPDRERYGPRDTAVYQIRTLDAPGRPVAAEASLGLVDESIYAIMPDPPLDAMQAFYGEQENHVSTAFSFPEIYLSSDKEPGPQQVRRDFPDTASWFPVVRTGADGRATLRVRLPDTLTTWRATVRAHTLATQVGAGISKIISSKPLLVRLETPRFFTQNDETLVAAVVHNETDSPRRVTVTLKAPPLQLRDPATAALDVPAHGLARHDWRTVAGAGQEATLLVAARADSGLNDAVELKRPIVPHGTERRDGASGELSGARATTHLTLPPGAILPATECRVTLTGSPAGVMLQALDYLHAHDYGTSENAVGWFLPDMTVAMALREVGLAVQPPSPLRGGGQGGEVNHSQGHGGGVNSHEADPLHALLTDLPRRVNDNLARLYRLQSSEGGWGWGEGSQQDAFWTAYVLYGLDQARRAGYLVDADVIERGTNALRQQWPKVPEESNRALCLYVLEHVEHRARPATRRALRQMAARAAKLQNYARSLVALALADAGEMEAGREVVRVLHAGAKDKGEETWWPEVFPWGFYSCNDNETTGYALMALIRLDPTSPRIERAARWLMRRREGDGWASTEDTASVIYALAAYVRHVARTQAPDCLLTLRVNGRAAGQRRITRANMVRPIDLPIDPARLHPGENEITLEKTGHGTPLFTAYLRTFVGDEGLGAAGSGLTVRREYLRRLQIRDVHGRWEEHDMPLGGRFHPGDEVLVKLTVHAPRACREVIVRDPLPAGGEGLNPLSDTSGGEYESEGGWYYGDLRREVRDRHVTFYAGLLRPGDNIFEYRFRAQIPGDYHVLPAQAYAAYIPEIWGASSEDRVHIRE